MSEIVPTPTPLPRADRATAPYYVLIRSFQHPFQEKKSTVYVKEGDFFRAQGGLTKSWGRSWIGIDAISINDARLKAHASEGTICPYFLLHSRVEEPN